MKSTFVRPVALARAFVFAGVCALPIQLLHAQSDSTRADSARRMERVTITAIRGGANAPIASTTLGRAAIRQRQFGQDVPMLLTGAVPSITAHTETGTPWGYSYLRLRGLDQTRINITLDGVPLNDMEDQVLYFANFADLLSSVQSVQVQPGTGTSTAGTASFAGSMNLETTPVARTRAGGELEVQLGSFGARRISLGGGTAMRGRLAAQARLGAVQTNGYRDHAGVAGGSFLGAAGWFGDRDVVKLTVLAGTLADTLSYVGATRQELDANWRFNPLNPAERDRFSQQMVALSHTHRFGETSSTSTTVYRNGAGGSFDYFALPDRYRYNLQHWWYGVTSALNVERSSVAWNFGVNANTYRRHHRAYLQPQPRLYANSGAKQDASAFGKATVTRGAVQWFGDLQLRHARFEYTPDAAAGVDRRSVDWTFVNPKVGVAVRVRPEVTARFSAGRTSREPGRSDMFAGEDDLNAGNVSIIGDFRRVRPEALFDLEAGIDWTTARGRLSLGGYAMEFRNDIARIGAPTAWGSIPRRNVGASHRRGLEVDGEWRLTSNVVVGGNATVSRNRIRQFVDSSTGTPTTLRNVEPMLSPALLTSHHVTVAVRPNLALRAEGRYQSRAGLDNTGLPGRDLPPLYVADASARLDQGRLALTVRAQNLLDRRAFGSGYVSDGVPYYFVLPGRGYFATFAWNF